MRIGQAALPMFHYVVTHEKVSVQGHLVQALKLVKNAYHNNVVNAQELTTLEGDGYDCRS